MFVPRPEYPRPQMVRSSFVNLNGPWKCFLDFSNSGIDRKMEEHTELYDREIQVPFCPESKLSGIGYTDFIPAIYYHRVLEIPCEWHDKRIILHFGGVDTIATVYINGKVAGTHRGGMCGFDLDITRLVNAGEKADLVVRAEDDLRSGLWGAGKQSPLSHSFGCSYTRVTGIWQTVWMEAVHKAGFWKCEFIADPVNAAVSLKPLFHDSPANARVELAVSLRGGKPVTVSAAAANNSILTAALGECELWEPGNPALYDAKCRLLNDKGELLDEVDCYFAFRTIEIKGTKLYLNGRELFLRTVLDQGYYPDGLWTAPSDEALKQDIELSMAAGFNGARLHQKVFEERFHYWADKLGYLTWSESANWVLDISLPQARYNFLQEWMEIVERLKAHPSIIAWSPLNETNMNPFTPYTAENSREVYHSWIQDIYAATKRLDPTRPVNDSSGYIHACTDLWTVHPYCASGEELKKNIFPENGGVMVHYPLCECEYDGQPYIIDEFGGFRYQPADRADDKSGWGYHGINLQDEDKFCDLIREQVELMLQDERISGYCYTQLTDIEQEQNGVLCYDRTPKVPLEKLREIFGKEPRR